MTKWTASLVVVALLLQAMLQTYALAANRGALAQRLATQVPLLEEVQLVRRQLHGILVETRQLAANGNDNAAALVAEFRRQGIRFKDDSEKSSSEY